MKGVDTRKELLEMTLALGTVLLELGEMLDRANVLPLSEYSDNLSRIAFEAEEGSSQSRYLGVWAYQVLEGLKKRDSDHAPPAEDPSIAEPN